MVEIFLKGNIPSLKNSKVMGKFPSKVVQKWLRLYGIQSFNSKHKVVKYFKTIKGEYNLMEICKVLKNFSNEDYPLILELHFIRSSNRSFDFINACQVIFDLWTAAELIPDDDMKFIVPMPLKLEKGWYSVNKEDPGVIIRINN